MIVGFKSFQNFKGGKMSPAGTREMLLEYMRKKGLSISKMARALGVERSSLSKWLNGEERKTVEDAVIDYFEKINEEKPEFKIVRTRLIKLIMTHCDYARKNNDIVVIVGNAGLGKTTGLLEYYKEHPYHVIYIKVDITFTSRELLIEIAENLGIAVSGSLRAMMREVVRALKSDPKLLIIDEADLLTIKQIELLRAIHDSAGCGLVLAGLPRLAKLLLTGPSQKENLAQLYSRVGQFLSLPVPDEEQIKEILAGMKIRYNGNFIQKILPHTRERGFRGMVKIVKKAVEIARNNRKRVLDGKDVEALAPFALSRIIITEKTGV